jgi:hypothetical protein
MEIVLPYGVTHGLNRLAAIFQGADFRPDPVLGLHLYRQRR